MGVPMDTNMVLIIIIRIKSGKRSVNCTDGLKFMEMLQGDCVVCCKKGVVWVEA